MLLRPNTKWIYEKIINIVFYIAKLKDAPLSTLIHLRGFIKHSCLLLNSKGDNNLCFHSLIAFRDDGNSKRNKDTIGLFHAYVCLYSSLMHQLNLQYFNNSEECFAFQLIFQVDFAKLILHVCNKTKQQYFVE